MRSVVLHAPHNVRVEQQAEPTIQAPTDAIIRVSAACVCGSDLWPYNGVEEADDRRMGHEYVGVVEAVGTQESLMQAIRDTRAGGHVGYVGVFHDVSIPGEELFLSGVHLHGGPAPVRRFLPELIDLIWNRKIDPGKVFDLELPLDDAAEAYAAMDERRAIKVLLRP